jgi:hypothetical protein
LSRGKAIQSRYLVGRISLQCSPFPSSEAKTRTQQHHPSPASFRHSRLFRHLLPLSYLHSPLAHSRTSLRPTQRLGGNTPIMAGTLRGTAASFLTVIGQLSPQAACENVGSPLTSACPGILQLSRGVPERRFRTQDRLSISHLPDKVVAKLPLERRPPFTAILPSLPYILPSLPYRKFLGPYLVAHEDVRANGMLIGQRTEF